MRFIRRKKNNRERFQKRGKLCKPLSPTKESECANKHKRLLHFAHAQNKKCIEISYPQTTPST